MAACYFAAMAYDYDELYRSQNDALGAPTQAFVDFFATLDQQELRVLDIGCGQGRDALFIGRAGHSVVGVDISPNGVSDLISAARDESLPVTGIVADIRTFTPKGMFDILLIDRTLHMLTEVDRLDVLRRLIQHVKSGGWTLIADERSNLAGFKAVFLEQEVHWTTKVEKRGFLFLRRDQPLVKSSSRDRLPICASVMLVSSQKTFQSSCSPSSPPAAIANCSTRPKNAKFAP